jgi:aminopeptidase YwaD
MKELLRPGIKMARSALELTQSVLEKFPFRVSGSQACLDAGHHLAEILREHCDEVFEEPFEVRPGSLENIGRVTSVAYILSAPLLLIGDVYVYFSAVLSLIGLVYALNGYVFFGRWFTFLFRKKKGCNVSGIIEPSGQVKQQILMAGHHDTAYVITYVQHLQKLASFRIICAFAAYVLLTVSSIVTSIEHWISGTYWIPYWIYVVIVIAGSVFLIPLFFVISRKISPGAGDNMIACTMAIKTAEYFAMQKRQGKALKNTRLVFLCNDAEEPGLYGSYEYAIKHKAELLSIPTFVINVDTIYKQEDLAVITIDRNGTVKLSPQMAEDMQQIASELGVKLTKKKLALGYGGTDAAEFAKIGVEATAFIGISTDFFGSGRVYHTPDDTVDKIEPEAVGSLIDIAVNYIVRKDEQGGKLIGNR